MESVGKEIIDRMDIIGKNTCFITLKELKDNFLNNLTVRLINPAKNKLGKLVRLYLATSTNSCILV